jgi:histone deacetylase 1/2
LKNILHVPHATKNLLSVNRLVRDNNAFLEFHPTYFSLKDKKTRTTLLEGRCERGLYPLKPHLHEHLPRNKQALGAFKPTVSTWHSRLGHASHNVVQRVIRHHKLSFSSNQENNVICDAYQQGKSHQLAYPKSDSVSSKPFELVFSDVWGPAPTSVGRHDFYVSFIDDYSKYTWIYLLRRKSEVFSCFKEFQTMVECQFNTKILVVQSDWSGEYQGLNTFFKHLGIAHHVSCPHAHQQNGSAERKHRHIVEVGLSLLAHAQMPLKFWDEAFLTAVFLINRLPTRVLGNDTPFDLLYKKSPDYSFLRTFGCTMWPNLRPYNSRKLDFRSKRCVFLGYNNLHKGFKCLDPSSGRVYISRDVVFDETIFPFSVLHPNAGARLRKEVELLPDVLKNPSSEFGNANMRDQTSINSLPTDALTSCADAGCNIGENSEKIGEEMLQNRRHFMHMQGHGAGAGHGADPPAPRTDAGSRSALDHARETTSAVGAVAAPSGSAEAGSSMAGSFSP